MGVATPSVNAAARPTVRARRSARLRRVKLHVVLAAVLSLSAAACIVHTGKPRPAPGTTEPAGDPVLTADGTHFAASRTYQGECAPAGSRGGCYSISLEPDGSYRQVLLDAAITGTYVVSGATVQLTPGGAAPPSTMTLSADRTKLDDYVYQPPTPEQGPIQSVP